MPEGLVLNEAALPTTPATGKHNIVADSADGKPKDLQDNGLAWPLVYDGMRDQNLLINGSFPFAERQSPSAATTYSNTTGRSYGADRWGITNENASAQYIRVDTSGAVEANIVARYYGKFTKITATGKLVISQVIESSQCLHVRGRKVRLQLRMKGLAAMTVRVALLQLAAAGTVDTMPATFISAFGANGTDPTFGTNLSKITPDVADDNSTSGSSALSCTLSTSWQRFGGTFTVPTDCKNLVVVVYGNNQLTTADGILITEAGLYDGTEIRDWAELSQASQLAACQRYYSKSFDVGTAPAQSAGALTGEVRIPSPVGATTAFPANWTWEFPQPMFKAPTLTLYNPQAANAQVRNQTLGTDCTLSAVTANGVKRCVIAATTPGATVAGTNILGVHLSADAEL